jgi:ferredoxin
MAKVRIERDECISCGNCWMVCPQFFEQNDEDNKSQINDEYTTDGLGEGEAPEHLVECTKQAEDECPAEAIKVVI